MTTASNPFPVPEDGHEDKLAFRLASGENPLEGKILHALAGSPRRFRDFKGLVKGSDTPITRALHRLSTDGLVQRGMTANPQDPEFYYSLTGLGVHVLFRSHEFQPAGEIWRQLKASHIIPA